MNFKFLFLTILVGLFLYSCEESNCCDTNVPEIDFVFSISFNNSSTIAEVCASDASNYVPEESTYQWFLNGGTGYSNGDVLGTCATYYDSGEYTISLIVTTPDGLSFSKAHAFSLDNIK